MSKLKIYHYNKPNRDLNSTFTKKKLKAVHKVFIADVITIIVMSLVIYHAFAPQQAVYASISPVASSLSQSKAIDLNNAKQQVLEQQINDLNTQLEQERISSLNLK
jgi:cell division protein FtsB